MRVTSLSVKGLFGVFDHEIPLNSSERVTIIHGPNGFGKTVILRMIAALAEGTTSTFEHIPFTEFCVTLDDGTARIIRRYAEESDSGKSRVRLESLARDSKGNTVILSPSLIQPEIPRSILNQVDRHVPILRLEGDTWLDSSDGRRYSLAEVLARFPKAGAAIPKKYRPRLYSEGSENLDVFFVETKRLDAESLFSDQVHFFPDDVLFSASRHVVGGQESPPMPPRVQQYSRDIVKRIRSVLTDYAKHSQESDRTFPERLVRFGRDGSITLPEREILSKMAELESQRRRLISLGLLDSESGLRDLTEDDVRGASAALTMYVNDIQGKLNVFDDIAQRIGSLMDIVNDRFKYKRIGIDREQGFVVRSDLNQPIQIEDLSSGEQHELVVLYELLFRSPKNGLILVDEPEISLHVAWQSRFLSDLIDILEVTDAYAVVATHSPTIIGERWDLAVELQGPTVTRGRNA